MFAVCPIDNCPHALELNYEDLLFFISNQSELIYSPCSICQDSSENWLCLTCQDVLCSRYVNGHMAQHFESTYHPISLSFSDASVWCNLCESYIVSPDLTRVVKSLQNIKFPEDIPIQGSNISSARFALSPVPEGCDGEEELSPIPAPTTSINIKESYTDNCAQESVEEIQETIEQEENYEDDNPDEDYEDEEEEEEEEEEYEDYSEYYFQMQSIPKVPFTREQLIQGLKDKTYQKIVVLTGAGISVAAGIPDFRTPGTGLYAQVAKLGLPYPEAIFSLDFLINDPQPFFKISKSFLSYHVKPVTAHYFIKALEDHEQLLMNFTQNIDGLELDAGLSKKFLVQAHGHMRTAHCIGCKQEYSMDEFHQVTDKGEVWYCQVCAPSSQYNRNIIKPDIVFFGENLPLEFFQNSSKIKEADLVIVMGTSLKVFPFANLISLVKPWIPVVLVNYENPGINRDNFLFLPGDIQASIRALIQDLGWSVEEVPNNNSS